MCSPDRRWSRSTTSDGATPGATSTTASGGGPGSRRHGAETGGRAAGGIIVIRTGGKVASRTTQAAHSAVVSNRRSMRPRLATPWPGPAAAAVRHVTWRGWERQCQAGSGHRRRVSLLHLLREVILLADLADQLELGLEPVGVLLLSDQDPGEQILGGVVASLAGGLDALVQERDRRVLELKIALELLLDGLADAELVVALQVGHALEEQDPADHLIRMAHLVDRLLADLVRQALEPPVLAHLGVHELLVDRRQLVGEQVVEEREHLFVALHRTASLRQLARWVSATTLTTRDPRHN